jgi:hypothetical protein
MVGVDAHQQQADGVRADVDKGNDFWIHDGLIILAYVRFPEDVRG